MLMSKLGEMIERYQPVIEPWLRFSTASTCWLMLVLSTSIILEVEVKSMSPGGKKVQATWCFVTCLQVMGEVVKHWDLFQLRKELAKLGFAGWEPEGLQSRHATSCGEGEHSGQAEHLVAYPSSDSGKGIHKSCRGRKIELKLFCEF